MNKDTLALLLTVLAVSCGLLGYLYFVAEQEHLSYRACVEASKQNNGLKCVPPGYEHIVIGK